ncbi:MAG: hypothetical protein V1779_04450 [bacterium]
MYKMIALLLLAGVLFSATVNTEAAPPKAIKGYVASLDDIVLGGTGKVDKAKATELAEKGSPIVFVTGKGKSAKIYFVYHEDGSFAAKKLAKYASNTNVGIIGKAKKINGLNILIAESIESMD